MTLGEFKSKEREISNNRPAKPIICPAVGSHVGGWEGGKCDDFDTTPGRMLSVCCKPVQNCGLKKPQLIARSGTLRNAVL